MCGIVGIWGRVDQDLIHTMMNRQAHRGPDGRGLYSQPQQGTLGHVRLSIMDPKDGQQPLWNENSSATIIANGEVYNHSWLRRHLTGEHQFRSTSDSETILHLFEEIGLETARRLDGMFAFAVVEDGALFLARDPLGIKPLYYGTDEQLASGSSMVFASELKALPISADNVREFPPGTFYHSRLGFQTYYQVPRNIPRSRPVEVHCRQVRRALEEAVTKRLMSDVPLGAFLSGGLDSSIIAALARQQMDQLHTFSVGVEGSRDLVAARLVAHHIGSIHHEYSYTATEVLTKLPEIIYHLESFDQDLVRSAIPTYFCARLAADHVKVILTGEGADEAFAGYTYYKAIPDSVALHEELHRSLSRLHNINLQRVDRLTMAHGIEGRVPFLDTAQTIPPELKLRRQPGQSPVEKWILRKAIEDLLPSEIVWRQKEQFDEGSGTVDLLPALLQSATDGLDMSAYRARYPQDRLRSAEECFYHRLLVEAFARPEMVLKNVGRWQVPMASD